MAQIHMIHFDFPELADVLRRTYDDGKSQRADIQEMLIRSDALTALG